MGFKRESCQVSIEWLTLSDVYIERAREGTLARRWKRKLPGDIMKLATPEVRSLMGYCGCCGRTADRKVARTS